MEQSEKEILYKNIEWLERIYNNHLTDEYAYKNEIRCFIAELRQVAGLSRDECSECGRLGNSMINGDCTECKRLEEEHREDIESRETAYRLAKGF
jgi:hypothetical protein